MFVVARLGSYGTGLGSWGVKRIMVEAMRKDGQSLNEAEMWYVRFRGTGNGEWISAASMKTAKEVFAIKHGVPVTAYIAASRKKS